MGSEYGKRTDGKDVGECSAVHTLGGPVKVRVCFLLSLSVCVSGGVVQTCTRRRGKETSSSPRLGNPARHHAELMASDTLQSQRLSYVNDSALVKALRRPRSDPPSGNSVPLQRNSRASVEGVPHDLYPCVVRLDVRIEFELVANTHVRRLALAEVLRRHHNT